MEFSVLALGIGKFWEIDFRIYMYLVHFRPCINCRIIKNGGGHLHGMGTYSEDYGIMYTHNVHANLPPMTWKHHVFVLLNYMKAYVSMYFLHLMLNFPPQKLIM